MTRRVAVAAIVPTPWRNGHGLTRGLLAAPGGAEDWQVGLADLVRDAPFSCFPGADRIFTLVEGGPARFVFEDGATLDCPPLVPVLFPGDRPLACGLDGPARALNVILARDRFHAAVAVLRLADAQGARVPPGTVVLYCAQGTLACGLAAGEALVDEAGLPDTFRVEARSGSCTLVAVAVTPIRGPTP